MIALPGHSPNCFVYLFGVFVIIIGFKTSDLAGKLGFDDCYCYLPPVRDV
jgi:hypothetical protein